MEFKLEDTINEINSNAKTLKTLSEEESNAVNSRINKEMEEFARDFRDKQNKTIEASSKVFLTF